MVVDPYSRTRDVVQLDDNRACMIHCHDCFVVIGQGYNIDAVRGKETDNVFCSDIFLATNVFDVIEEVHDRYRSLCYGEDRGKKMYSVEIFCIGNARFRFGMYDTEVQFYVEQVIADIDATDNSKSVLVLRMRQWWVHHYVAVGIQVS
jgi:hypothetical protein